MNHDELEGKTIRSIFVEDDKSIWIGTDGDGLKYLDYKSHKVYNIHQNQTLKIMLMVMLYLQFPKIVKVIYGLEVGEKVSLKFIKKCQGLQ